MALALPPVKVVFEGARKAGKTEFLRRFVNNSFPFNEGYKSTIGVDFSRKCIRSEKLKGEIPFQVWDVSGKEASDHMMQVYERYTQAVFYFVDLYPETPIREMDIQQDIQAIKERNPNCPIVLVGSKADKRTENSLSPEQILEAIKVDNVDKRIVTSAKDCTGIENMEAFLLEYAERSIELEDAQNFESPTGRESNAHFFHNKSHGDFSDVNAYPGSCFTPDQQGAIQKLINSLQKEINSCWPYPNKGLKEFKVQGLKYLLRASMSKNVQTAVADTLVHFEGMQSGKYSTRTADLLCELQNVQKQVFTN